MGTVVHLTGPQHHPGRSGSRKATTLQAEGPTPPCPIFFCGEKRSLPGGMSTVLLDNSAKCKNHGFLGQYGAMTVTSAPELRSFAAKSSSSSQGGLHQLLLLS